jgi:hypothetical protein
MLCVPVDDLSTPWISTIEAMAIYDGCSIAELLSQICGRGENSCKAGKGKLRTVGVEAWSGVRVLGGYVSLEKAEDGLIDTMSLSFCLD